jgi:hypothetical protein
MARLTRIDIRDCSRLFAVLYAMLGVVPLVQHAMESFTTVEVPVGFVLGPIDLSLHVKFEGLSVAGTNVGLLLMPVLFAISGAISGFVLALLFNLIGRILQVRVTTDDIASYKSTLSREGGR